VVSLVHPDQSRSKVDYIDRGGVYHQRSLNLLPSIVTNNEHWKTGAKDSLFSQIVEKEEV
jgi:hypothetical protein